MIVSSSPSSSSSSVTTTSTTVTSSSTTTSKTTALSSTTTTPVVKEEQKEETDQIILNDAKNNKNVKALMNIKQEDKKQVISEPSASYLPTAQNQPENKFNARRTDPPPRTPNLQDQMGQFQLQTKQETEIESEIDNHCPSLPNHSPMLDRQQERDMNLRRPWGRENDRSQEREHEFNRKYRGHDQIRGLNDGFCHDRLNRDKIRDRSIERRPSQERHDPWAQQVCLLLFIRLMCT